ncbi:methyltransferase domain-containing protein [Aliiglaciecola sp.]|nr:methyltransferase domain-containing protein [Aliiglaciecola sp.]
MWICPACQQPLMPKQGGWFCASNHHFDKAKEGYVNLQLAQERKSKSPGDSKEMIQARRTFLQAGHYDLLVSHLANTIAEHAQQQKLTVFDAGCGEGYYLGGVATMLNGKYDAAEFYGCDISKPAIQRAAKTYKYANFSVASTYKIPLTDNSVDVVIQVFAPSSEEDIARILKPNGLWICVNPASRHLVQLKAQIYDEWQPHDIEPHEYAQFESFLRQPLAFTMNITQPLEREALLKMTPFYWQASEQQKQQFSNATFAIDADFDVHVMRKKGDQ